LFLSFLTNQKEDCEVRAKRCETCRDRHTTFVKQTQGRRERGMNDKLRKEYLDFCAYSQIQMAMEQRAVDDLKNGDLFLDWPESVSTYKYVS
jgi:hypothetical protein